MNKKEREREIKRDRDSLEDTLLLTRDILIHKIYTNTTKDVLDKLLRKRIKEHLVK